MANQYFTCTLNAWRSGQTLYANMTYSRSGSYYYSDSSFPNPTMNLGGVSYTDTDFGNRVRSGVYVGSVTSTTFSRTVGGSGDRTVTWTAGSGQRSDFAGSWSKTVNFPVTYTAPNTPTISAVPATSHPMDTINVTYGTTSFGNPSSGTVYVYGGTSSTPTTQLVSKTTTGNSTFAHNEPLIGNTKYYYRSRATNNQLWSSYSSTVSATTYPAAPTITVNSVDYKNIVLSIASPVQGAAETMTLYYTVDGGSPVSTGTITSGNSNTVNLTFSPNTTHTIRAYIETPVGTSTVATTTVKTELPFYGSVNGESKEIVKMYGSVGGETKEIQHLYGAVPKQVLTTVSGEIRIGGSGNVTAFDGDVYLAKIREENISEYWESVEVVWSSTLKYSLVFSGNGSSLRVNTLQQDITDWGITASTSDQIAGSDFIDLTPVYSTQYVSKLIF